VCAVRARGIWETVPVLTAYVRPARFDFRTGLPDPSLFPRKAWRRVLVRALRSSEMAPGMYAPSDGSPELRAAIARHIGVSRGVATSPGDVMVTSGAQQALDILARVLIEPGDVIAVEDPGYQPARHVFRALGARVIGTPVDGEGIVVEALPKDARAVYVTPSHQYPLGVAMSLARRRALLAWAEGNDAAVIEDDYDNEFRFDGRPLEPLQTLDDSGRVVYIGTFSKTMLPALRLGFMVVPPSLREAAHKAKFVSDWHTPSIAQDALAQLIDGGQFARHLRKACSTYRERREIVTRMIRRDFAEHLELVPSSSGLHVAAYARRASVDAIDMIASSAADLGVGVQSMASFRVDGKPRAGVVLGYGAIETRHVAEGLRRLLRCFDEAMPRSSGQRGRRR
jgi:GntR family transcriptional regulator / MocR family aminotransferase